MKEVGQKIADKSVELVTEFMINRFTFGEAMASLSMAMIKIAQNTGVDKKEFMDNMSKDWDRLDNVKTKH